MLFLHHTDFVMTMRLKTYWSDLLHILFPQTCAGCDAALLHQEEVLCSSCLFHLPMTDFHLDRDNAAARQLWGKLDARFAVSMMRMPKTSFVENIIHKIKYRNQPEIATHLGKVYGAVLTKSGLAENIDLIVPIPIHPSKRRKRGYNQSMYFAKGLSLALGIPYDDNSFVRTVASTSQTKKSRIDRYDNVEHVFSCRNKANLKEKYILLVDDVLTTGATIASAGTTLINECGCRIAVATLVKP